MFKAFFLVCLVATQPVVATAAELVANGQYEWANEDENFGGFSGLWVSPDGADLLALSDRGHFVRAQISRNDGKITGIQASPVTLLPLVDDRPPADFLVDAEGLAVAPDGSIYVSYEGHHRVWKFNPQMENPQWTHKWDYFWRFQNNSGLEALAVDKDGVVYAIPERSGKWERPFPVQRYKDGTWDETLSITRSKRFLVVGADFGPDGKLYVLERDFDVLSAFKSRVRRFTLSDDGFDSGETLLETRYSALGNAEGISLWVDDRRRTIVTIIADDNFNPVQKTWVSEFILTE